MGSSQEVGWQTTSVPAWRSNSVHQCEVMIPESERNPCLKHIKQGWKKECRDCFENYRESLENRDDDWHLEWERDIFGDS